jgi:hypothetical protein
MSEGDKKTCLVLDQLTIKELRASVPIQKEVDLFKLTYPQRKWIQVRMWELYNFSIIEKREITWEEIYKSLEGMRTIHRIVRDNIGPNRASRPMTKDEEFVIRKLLLLGDIDEVVKFFWKIKVESSKLTH